MNQILRRPPPYTQGFVDRNGRPRWYYRRRGFPRSPLPGLPWSPEFMAAYERAAEGAKLEIGRDRSKPGTFTALIASYYKTADYQGLRPITQQTYRNILERWRAEHGDKRVAHLERRHVQAFMAERATTPASANRLLRMLHIIMQHAIDLGLRRDDPTSGIRKLKEKTEGFTTWEEEHIATFFAFHKPGSRAHTALTLLLFTGQRRGDVVRMGPGMVRDGWLHFRQSKTDQPMEIPILPPLQAVLDALPPTKTFLTSDRPSDNGGPLTPESFGNWFRDVVTEVKDGEGKRLLPDGLSAHGLRKASCRRLAEGGCTPHQIMAISGHKTLAEVTRYTVAASRRDLAKQAAAALAGGKESVKPAELV